MARTVPLASALIAVFIGLVQFREGIIPLLDTVTYWSGAEAVARGDLFSTALSPSFSNFSAIEFLNRGGTLPFVDFPIGYPLVAGTLGALIGVHAAMQVLVLFALAVLAAGIAAGLQRSSPSSANDLTPSQSPWPLSIGLGALGVLIILSPAMRLVTQGALSESLFCAAVLWLVISLARYRNGGSWSAVAIVTVMASLLRFLGAPLAVLAGWERYRRTGEALRSLMWAIALMMPAALNIVLAASAGGGHSAKWRGINRLDIETFVRSLGGWFDARQGDIRRTYFTTEGPSWWSWPLAVLWLLLVLVAVVRVVFGDFSARNSRPLNYFGRSHMPAIAELALSAAGIMTVGLVAGIMGFDALVIADNRLMLPSGILTISALAWWFASLRPRLSMSRRVPALKSVPVVTFIAGLIIWSLTAVRPWQATEMFSQSNSRSPLVQTVNDLLASPIDEVRVVISNDADAVHWQTGIPSAYTPMPVKPLSGESVDEVPLYQALPCALQRARGVVVISNQATFSAVNRTLLDLEVARGTLTASGDAATTVYRPTPNSCTSQDR